MNAMPKLVASRSLDRATAWQNSAVLTGDLLAAVRERKQAHDIVVAGSASIVRTLAAEDLVDEYRLLVFPLVLGAGERLFPDGSQPRKSPWWWPRPRARPSASSIPGLQASPARADARPPQCRLPYRR